MHHHPFRSTARRTLVGLTLALSALPRFALAQYDPPPGYYNSAAGLTGAPLKAALNAIIDGHTAISYSNREAPLEALDQDPANSLNVLLVYSGVSLPKTDFLPGMTSANTEHLWANAFGIDDGAPAYGDLNNLRPCDETVNSARANKYYDNGGVLPAHPEAPLCRTDADSWEVRDIEKGDIARSMFYMDTRYEGDGTDGFARNLQLVENTALIITTDNNFGKLSTLVLWHFTDPPATDERIRNHTIYTTYQNNRNPFTDHPEYVWAIWGTSPNDSRLYVGGVEPPDGASALGVEQGPIIRGSALPPQTNVTLNKTGTAPTTFDVVLTGSAASTGAGPRQAFLGGALNRNIPVGITGSTAAPTTLSGIVTIDNTDLTSAAMGQGLDDLNDVITVSLDILDHANASFDSGSDDNTLTIDFGTVNAGGPQSLPFTIYNLEGTPSLTAGLDLDAINGSGDTGELTTDLAPFAALAAAGSQSFLATIDTPTCGDFSATYTLTLSDENLPGAIPTTSLVLTLVGHAVTPGCSASDANCDTFITVDDIDPFVNTLLGVSPPCAACAVDENCDAVLNATDIPQFVVDLMAN
jgi:endonuclease I